MLRLPPPLRPMLSLAMATMAADTAMAATDMDVSMVDTEDTTARGRLRLMLSPDTDTTAVDTDMAVTDTDVSMVDTADTTDKLKSDRVNLYSFTATFILVLKLSLV